MRVRRRLALIAAAVCVITPLSVPAQAATSPATARTATAPTAAPAVAATPRPAQRAASASPRPAQTAAATAGTGTAPATTGRAHPTGAGHGKPPPAQPTGGQIKTTTVRDLATSQDDSGYRLYRIPALVVTRDGTLIASYDGRWTSGDLPSHIDNLIRISHNGGRTWSTQRVNRTGPYPDGFGDPSLAYNPKTNRIFLFYAGSEREGFFGGHAGNDPNDPYVLQADLSYSDDNGRTWHNEVITPQVKDPSWGGMFASSGTGLYVANGPYKGRIVQQYNVLSNGGVYAVSAWTDDNGATWHHGQLVGPGSNENKVTVMSNGNLLLNVRSSPYRLRAVSTDGGATWSELTPDPALIDPNDNGSIMRVFPNAAPTDPRSQWMISTNNDDPQVIRQNTTVRLSCDNGQTWPVSRVLDPGSSGYSTAIMLPHDQVGVLYERKGYQHITFASFPLSQLAGLCAPLSIPSGTTLPVGATTGVPVTITNEQPGPLAAGTITLGGLNGVSGPALAGLSGTAATPALAAGVSATVNVPVTVTKDVAPESFNLTAKYTVGHLSSTTLVPAATVPPPGVTQTVLDDTAAHTFNGTSLTDITTPDLPKVQGLSNGSISITFNTTNGGASLPQVLLGASKNTVDDYDFLITVNPGGRPYFEIRPSRAQGYLARCAPTMNIADGKDHTLVLAAQDGQTTFSVDGVTACTQNSQVFFSALPALENMTLGGVRFQTASQSAPTDQWFFTGSISNVTVKTTQYPTIDLTPKPAVRIQPVLDSYAYNAPPGLGVNDSAIYMVRITNTGNVPLTALTTTGDIDLSGCGTASLAPGANILCQRKSHAFTTADVAAGGYTPSVTVNATAGGQPFTAMQAGERIALPPAFQPPAAPAAATVPVTGCTTVRRPVNAEANTEESFAHFGAENTPASNAIDSDPNTFWSSGWSYGVQDFPNWITLDLGTPQRVCALNYLPRQGNTNGNIGTYRIYVSNNPNNWGRPAAGGTFVTGNALQTAYLPKAATGRYVKLVAYDDIGANHTQTTTAAELTVNVIDHHALPAVIPQPTSEAAGHGPDFALTPTTPIVADRATADLGPYLASLLKPATGYQLPVVDSFRHGPQRPIVLSAGGPASLGDEGYTLTANHKEIAITGHTAQGVFYGIQTLRQLLPPAINSPAQQPGPWTVPAVNITDRPRFAVRGAMLDVGRRFYPVADVERMLDYMAAYKLDEFHFHLTEDQGWRIAISAYPALTQIGGSGQSGISPGTVDNGLAGPWFYTKDQYKQIIDYAKARFIQVIPEIDGPGHMGAAMASIPDLNCDDVAIPVYTKFQRGPNLCLSDPQHLANVAQFLDTVLADVAGQNPTSDYLHVGGDESDTTTAAEYTAYTKIADAAVAATGKKLMAWNSWASGVALPPGAVLQNYAQEHGDLGLAANVQTALESGNKILMSPADHTYLDIKYDPTVPYGLTWINGGYIDLARAYRWDPNTVVPNPDGSGQLDIPDSDIFGVELALWSDNTNQNGYGVPWSAEHPFNPVSDYMDTMLFPRLPAVAEVAWSAKADRENDPAVFANFQNRLVHNALGWDYAGIGYHRAGDVPWLPRAPS